MRQFKTLSFVLLFLFVAVFLNADYYDSVSELVGEDLLYGLRSLISTNSYSNYTGAKTFLFQELDNHNGTVYCIYTGEDYQINSSYNGQSNPNTEHTYAQSWFSSPESSIKKADLHHLFVCTMNVNSARGNLPFGNVASTAASTVYYANTPYQSYRGYNTWQRMVFQVCPENRGNIARAVLYFYVRYGDSLTQGGEDMLPTLIAWHYSDLPDAQELSRNNAVYNFQSNRNPFIDHPEYVNRIFHPSFNEDEHSPALSLRIDKIYPNPFTDKVNFLIDGKSESPLNAEIYNLKGQKVYSTKLSSKEHEFSWDGVLSDGSKAASGIYFIQIHNDKESVRGKMLMMGG